jgi:hypothetical protein
MHKLETILRDYWKRQQFTGLCARVGTDGDNLLFTEFLDHARLWPHALYERGVLRQCFVPCEIGSVDNYAATADYFARSDHRTNAARLDLANFILRRIARQRKKKFIPIVFPLAS